MHLLLLGVLLLGARLSVQALLLGLRLLLLLLGGPLRGFLGGLLASVVIPRAHAAGVEKDGDDQNCANASRP